jgi:hypothetical protein
MKQINILILGFIIGIFISCDLNDDGLKVYSLNGKAQKGPFISGTTITFNELNTDLVQTGKSFTTTISSDDGSFHFDAVELTSDLALLTANGFYFSEIYGELSASTLSLQAITGLSGKESVNINVLTHLIKGRVENLVESGMNFREANEQAKSEFFTFLGVTDPFETDFDNLDISVDEEYNAVLLAFSLILQRYTMILNERPALTAELTQLLSNLSSDFATDGVISEHLLIDKLLANISQLNLIDIRENIEERYADLGQEVTIPEFEKYISKFQEKYSDNLYADFTYPESASPFPANFPDEKVPNILVPADTVFSCGAYTLAAIVPLNADLTIKFIGENSDYKYVIAGPVSGWELINEYPNGFTLNAQRENTLMSMSLNFELPGEATIEYYENDDNTPTFSKDIRWE